MRTRPIGPIGLAILAISVAAGCSAFTSDSPADSDSGVDGDGGAVSDAPVPPVNGQPRSRPDAPPSVAASPVPIVVAVTTLAGSGNGAFADGLGAAASFFGPRCVAVDGAGNVYVCDNQRIRKVTPAGAVTTLAGSGTAAFADGAGGAASFNNPQGLAVDGSGKLYVADSFNHAIRTVTPAGVVATLAGSGVAGSADGAGAAAGFNFLSGVSLDTAGSIGVADAGNNRIRRVTLAGAVTALAGSGTKAFADGEAAAASFSNPYGIAADASGNVYIADTFNNRIRKVSPAGTVTTVGGSGTAAFADGVGTAASFNLPRGIAADSIGNVYVADTANGRIRRISAVGTVTTLAGSASGFADGAGNAALFSTPFGVAVDAVSNLYVADTSNNRIRKLTTTGIGQLTVTWNEPSSAGRGPIKSYSVSATASGQSAKNCQTTGATTCTIVGLTSGVSYALSVTASSDEGTGPPSATTTATPN